MIYTLTLNPALDREMSVPEIALDQVLRAGSIRNDLGGKGFNVSRALLAMGTESTALGFIGGAIGDLLSSGLASLGIHTDFVQVSGETRINISVVSDDHAHYFKVNEAGPSVTIADTTALLEKIRSLTQPNDWWVLAGSLPPGLSPAFIPEVILLVQAAGAHAAIDMEGLPLRLGCASHVYLAKPNAMEAGELIGRPINTVNQAIGAVDKIHAIGAQKLAISLGKAGAVYSDGEHMWKAVPPEIVEQNPIGAGDAMLAGLVWGLIKDFDGGEVIRWGVACGAAAASLGGTAMGTLELVKHLAAKVHIEKARLKQ
jgi:1-phosphofructokinase family hexose kinase